LFNLYIADCGCNSYAGSCRYDVATGHGVCESCGYMSTGDKCEQCLDFYYVNPAPHRTNTTCNNGPSYTEMIFTHKEA